jgi:hypothetical protein
LTTGRSPTAWAASCSQAARRCGRRCPAVTGRWDTVCPRRRIAADQESGQVQTTKGGASSGCRPR